MAQVKVQWERLRRILAVGALVGLGVLFYSTIHPFVASLAWAVILALALWPLHRRVRKGVPGPVWVAPLLMVFFIAVGLVVPLGLTGLLVFGEAQSLLGEVRAQVMGEKGKLADSVGEVPVVGERLKAYLEELRHDSAALESVIRENREVLFGIATKAMGDVVETIFKILVCLFAAYFLFRYGELLADQTRLAVRRLGGSRLENLLPQIRETVRAVVYGTLLTAAVQAALAAVGFLLAGVQYPLLLALLTFVLAFIPFGPPAVWLPASISVVMEGRTLAGVLLFAWGAGAISTVDNIIRPVFIGQATKMPILLVFIAVLGGVMSFGMVGLFVGPVVMGVVLALWREWILRRGEIDGEGATPKAAPGAGADPSQLVGAPGSRP